MREAVGASIVILALIGGAKTLGQIFPQAQQILVTLALAAQLYGPFLRSGPRGLDRDHLGLRVDRLATDLMWAGAAAAVVTVPYAVGFMAWGGHGTFEFTIPRVWGPMFFFELAVIAAAEEIFFRGYLQTRFDDGLGTPVRLLGASVGWGLVLASLVFAAAHFIGEWNPARWGPFFPGLLFGWLRARTGTVVGAAIFHAYCNALADVLHAST